MAGLSGRNPDDLSLSSSVDLDARTGTARLRLAVPTPSGRGGLGPDLALSYSSSGGNSEIGAGWSLSWLPAIGLYTEKRLPLWDGANGLQMGGDELAPWLDAENGWQPRGRDLANWSVAYYRMRRGGTQVRVEKWVERASGRAHFRTRDARNTVTIYGARPDAEARIADPADESRTLTWLPELQLDPHGNAVWFDYAPETGDGVDRAARSEPLRDDGAQRYPKRVLYGNATPLALDDSLLGGAVPAGTRWCFQVVLDYGDHSDPVQPTALPDREWPQRLHGRARSTATLGSNSVGAAMHLSLCTATRSRRSFGARASIQ